MATTSESFAQIKLWVNYHQVLGVSVFYLFVDGQAARPEVISCSMCHKPWQRAAALGWHGDLRSEESKINAYSYQACTIGSRLITVQAPFVRDLLFLRISGLLTE